MTEERVFVVIRMGDTSGEIITSRGQVNEFIESWKQTDGEKVLSISGVADDRDANICQHHIEKERISAVYVQEIKL